MPEATILVADDEPMVIGVVSTALNLAGFRVLTAGNGTEALRLCEAEKGQIDLALLDYRMPEMSATDLFGQLRELFPSIKIIIMSGYSEQLQKLHETHHSTLFDDILPKPFLPSQLIEKVTVTLRQLP